MHVWFYKYCYTNTQNLYKRHCYDALTSILFHSIIQVCCESRSSLVTISAGLVSYTTLILSRHPAFFDASVCNTLSPSIISHASVSARAAAGEALKDKCDEDNVITAGELFCPLIVDTFGVWYPFAVKALTIIAARTTTKSGLPTKNKGF